ncbi:MAG: LptF/LptG family permease [Elusimicrobia bacterium]|nr:LptF/LptG family permease [Elusimicrobiota bacterium]
MKIIDKYLTITFSKSLAISVAVFSFIICITYIFDRLYIIFKLNASLSSFFLSLLYSFPNWLSLIFPVAILLATLFSVGDLARNNEITALRTSGCSILRIVSSIIFAGILFTIIFIFFNNTVLINSNKKFTQIWKYDIKKQKYQTNEGFNVVQIEKDKIFSAKMIDGNNEKISGLILLELDDKMNLKQKITAKEAKWKDGWLEITDTTICDFYNGNFTIKKFTAKKIPFNKKPSEFINIKKDPDELSYREISDLIVRLKKSGIPSHQEMVFKYSKLARPVSILTMLLLGIPFAIKMAKTAKIFSFAVAIFVGFLYWGGVSLGQAMGLNQTLSPLLASWLSNIIFTSVAVFLILKIE